MKDIRIIKTKCHLTIPIFEYKTKMELLIEDAKIEEYEDHEQNLILYFNFTYYFDLITEDKEIYANVMGFPVKKGCFQEMIERSIYKILRYSSCTWMEQEIPRLPSTCGFFYWYTFQKLLPWIRENWDFSFSIEGTAEDGALIRAEYGYTDNIYKVYAQDRYWGSMRIYPGGSDEWWKDDTMSKDPAKIIYSIGGGAKNLWQESALIEDFYQSKQLITPSIEKALTSYHHERTLSKADENVIAMYYHYPVYQHDPLQYYIVHGKKCGENSWRLYGLIYNTVKWAWGEILIGECAEEIPAFSLPPGTMRRTEVSGQRLEDALKQYAPPGWAEHLI